MLSLAPNHEIDALVPPHIALATYFCLAAGLVLTAQSFERWLPQTTAAGLVAAPLALASFVAVMVTLPESCVVCGVTSGTAIVVSVVLTQVAPSRLSMPAGGTRVMWFRRVAAASLGLAATVVVVAAVNEESTRRWVASFDRIDAPRAAEAKVVVQVFTDYQCPFCRARHQEYAPVLERLKARYGPQVAISIGEYPLDTACNKFVTGQVHAAACAAALVAKISDEVGRGNETREYFFSHQRELTTDSVFAYAERIGLDVDRYRHAAEQRVQADIALGNRLGVSATPTYFVNGLVIGRVSADELEAIVDVEVKR